MIVTPVMEDDVCGHDVGYVQFGKKGEHFPLTNMQFIYEKYTNRKQEDSRKLSCTKRPAGLHHGIGVCVFMSTPLFDKCPSPLCHTSYFVLL